MVAGHTQLDQKLALSMFNAKNMKKCISAPWKFNPNPDGPTSIQFCWWFLGLVAGNFENRWKQCPQERDTKRSNGQNAQMASMSTGSFEGCTAPCRWLVVHGKQLYGEMMYFSLAPTESQILENPTRQEVVLPVLSHLDCWWPAYSKL